MLGSGICYHGRTTSTILPVTVVFLPNFKHILTGYKIPAELRRLGRAVSSQKGLRPATQNVDPWEVEEDVPIATTAPRTRNEKNKGR